MVVLILEKVSASLRGELSRWMVEPSTGVFVGKMSGMVRDKLWEKCTKRMQEGGVMQLFTMNNEQGFSIRNAGNTRRRVEDFEGLTLIKTPNER